MTREMIFEKKTNDGWQPVRCTDFKPGDMARLKDCKGQVVEEGEVIGTNYTDPDSHVHSSLCLGEPHER